MKALCWHGKSDMRYETVPDPKIQDGRDAIIAADQARYGGAHFCAIWEEFAARGLGASATQGSTASKTDGTQAFDIPLACHELTLTKTASPDPVPGGGLWRSKPPDWQQAAACRCRHRGSA